MAARRLCGAGDAVPSMQWRGAAENVGRLAVEGHVMLTALFDMSALNWFADNEPDFRLLVAAVRDRLIRVIVHPETTAEIRDTKDPQRRAKLEAVCATFFPLAACDTGGARLHAMAIAEHGPDPVSAMDALAFGCDRFVTCEHEMFQDKPPTRNKVAALKQLLVGVPIVEPPAFCAEVAEMMRSET